MFAAPPTIKAEILTRMPDALRRPDQGSSWLDVKHRSLRMHSFLEGPAFDRDGNLHVVDIAHGRVFQITPGGAWTVRLHYDGWPTGLKLDAKGDIYITDNMTGLLKVSPADWSLRTVLDGYEGKPFLGTNDLCFSRSGDIYFTDPGPSDLLRPTGRVFRYSAAGKLTLLAEGFAHPNGIALSPGEDMLYIAVTQSNAVWRCKLFADGGIGRMGVFVQLSGSEGSGPDGITVDREGNLFVAHATLGTVWGFTRLGEPLVRIVAPAGLGVTNLAFRDAAQKSLVVTEAESGSVLVADLSAIKS